MSEDDQHLVLRAISEARNYLKQPHNPDLEHLINAYAPTEYSKTFFAEVTRQA